MRQRKTSVPTRGASYPWKRPTKGL